MRFIDSVPYAFLLFLVTLFKETYQEKDASRVLRWVKTPPALTFLSKEMSMMDTFKEKLLQPMMIERVPGSEGNKKVQEHIKSFMTSIGWHVEEDRFEDDTPYGKKEFNNIIATFDVTKPVKVVLACHFDSKYFAKGKFVGAIDSAVPCAILMDSARQLQCLMEAGPKDKSSARDLTLQLLFLDGEEAFKEWTRTDSLYGARHLAEKWSQEFDPVNKGKKKIATIREFILLDLIGHTRTQFSQQFSATSELYKQLGKTEKLLRKNGYLTGKHDGPIFTSREGWGGIEDDHKPFQERGVPIVHLISTPFPPVWHKTTDDWDHLDFDFIDDFSRIFRVFLSNLLHLQPENRGCRKKHQHTEL